MMKNVQVKHYETGLIIKQDGLRGMVCIPNILKTNFYETLLNSCLNGKSFDWTDLEGDEIAFHYEYKNHFNCFINGLYVGDMPFIPLSETSVAIPIDTNDSEQLFEIYTSDDEMSDCYLLYQSELF